jgi:hypothetical protein
MGDAALHVDFFEQFGRTGFSQAVKRMSDVQGSTCDVLEP